MPQPGTAGIAGTAAALAAAWILAAAPIPALAAKSQSTPPRHTSSSEVRIQVIDGGHPDDGKLDQLHLVCTDGGDNVDLALPRRWVEFVIRHLDSEIEIDGINGDEVDLKLLWETIEDLRPGEEILIEERGHWSRIRLWLE